MEYSVETFDLTKIFDSKEKKVVNSVKAVNHVNLAVSEGEFFGLLGPNGAGKSTLIKMLCTIVLPTEGTAKINGFDILKEPYNVRRSFGWFPGETGGRSLYWRLNADDNLLFYAYLQNVPKEVGIKRIDALLEFFGLIDHRKKLVKDYSTGMKVRLMLARALLHNPQILFMDEPTLGLDTVSAVETRKLLKALNKELGKTIIFTSHNMFEVEQLCERVAIMRRGSVIADSTPFELREKLRDVHAVEVELKNHLDAKEVLRNLENLPTVIKVIEMRKNFQNLVVRLHVEDEFKAIPIIVEKLNESFFKVSSIHQVEPTFEDIYVKLVGEVG